VVTGSSSPPVRTGITYCPQPCRPSHGKVSPAPDCASDPAGWKKPSAEGKERDATGEAALPLLAIWPPVRADQTPAINLIVARFTKILDFEGLQSVIGTVACDARI
jgi:hypothetical protein